MKALKLQFAPTKNQYKVLDEMFGKWASICNRYNRYSNSQKLKENIIKDKLRPKDNLQAIQFSETMVNQRAKKDNTDLKRAMEEQGEQKEDELRRLKERIEDIKEALENKEQREINPQRPSNMRPKGWFKFHTLNHWEKEVKKLDKQIKKKEGTIKKIKEGRIYFKPKRVSLWSNSFKVSFKSKKLMLKPFVSKMIIIDLITEPIQPHKNSSLKSKQFLESQIRDFLNFSVHSNFFGLANDETPLINFQIYDFFIIPKIKEKFSDKEENERLKIFDKRIDNYIDIVKKKIGRKLSSQEIKIIELEKKNIWNEEDKLRIIKDLFDEIKEIKKQRHIGGKSELLKEKKVELNKKRSELLGRGYLILVSKLKNELLNRKKDLLNNKYSKFDNKIKKIKKDYNLDFDGEIIKKEGVMAFSNPDEFLKYKFSENYAKLINRITSSLLNYKDFLDLDKYPIIFRKPINKIKKIHNLKPSEWKYYIQFAYEQISKPKTEMKNILGIDRGLTHILAYSIFEPENNKFIVNKLEPNPVTGWKWKLRKIKRSIQHMERGLRAQKNIHIQENQMKKRLRSIEDKVENLYHNLSRKIVNLAKEKNASIVFEKLEGQGLKQHGRKKSGRSRALNYALSLFDYGKIAQLIKYKAENEGISVYHIDPAYTSQNCAKCVLELRRFAEPKTIFYIDDLKEGDKINENLLEGMDFKEANVDRKLTKKIYLTAKDKNNMDIKLLIEIKYNKIIISKGHNKKKEIKNGKFKEEFESEEDVAEFQTRKEGEKDKEKIAVLDYVYTRGKEIINEQSKYTGNKKAGFCMKHGQVDADLNASRVIALCKNFEINNPEYWE